MRSYPQERFSRAIRTTRSRLLVDARTVNGLVELGTITLLGRERAVPSQDNVGLGHRCHLFQSLFVQLLAKLGECFAIADRRVRDR